MNKETVNKALVNMLCRARQCWEQGIMGAALMELGMDDMLICACDDMLTRQNEDGRLCTVENTRCQNDPAACLRPVLKAWKLTGDERYLSAARRNIDFLLNSADKTADGLLWHILGLDELWADSAAMVPPALAAMGYTDEAVRQMTGLLDRLRLENGLYGHRLGGNGWVRRAPWAAGNGWILAGIAWTLSHMEKNSADAAHLAQLHRSLKTSMEAYRLPCGLFRDVLDDPSSFTDCQSAVMLAYSDIIMYENGCESAAVIDSSLAVFETVTSHIDSHGAVRDCPGSPDFSKSGTSTEMQAFYLMLYAALDRNGAFVS